MTKIIQQKGFTLVETLIAIALFTGLMVILTTFQKDIFINNAFIQSSLIIESEARGALKRAIAELRAASQSNDGQFPIVLADENKVTFFSDINNDGLREKIRYFVATSSLMRGVIKPTGIPATYVDSEETLSTVVHDIVNPTSTPVFDFYDSAYNGTSSPMVSPVDIVSVRLIRITIMIDTNPTRAPAMMTFSSQVMVRNLKDNL